MNWEAVLLLSLLVLLVAGLRARQSLRHTKDTERGSPPGKGYHTIDASYASGAGGGGQVMHYKVPRDPQEYAKHFVPKDRSDR